VQFAFKAFTTSAFALNTEALFFFRCETVIVYLGVDADRNKIRFCINWGGGGDVLFFHKVPLRSSQQGLMNECNKIQILALLRQSRF
jgi:hypothetical protein